MAILVNLVLFGVSISRHGVTRPSEDPYDAVVMISHNYTLGVMFLIYTSMLVVHDYCGTVVSKRLDSVLVLPCPDPNGTILSSF